MTKTFCRCCGTAMETDHCPTCFCEEFEEACERGVQFDREIGAVKWQKARLLKRGDEPDAPPVGFELWVYGRPALRAGEGINRVPCIPAVLFETNVYDPSDGQQLGVKATMVELLPDFCDEPPRITWGSWG